MIKTSLSLIVVIFISSCCAEKNMSEPNSEIPSDWVKIFAGNEFSFKAPADTILIPDQGGDSFTGSIKSPDFELTFDYGLYSNPLEKTSDKSPDYTSRKLFVDNKEASIVTYTSKEFSESKPYFIGIHFPIIRQSSIGAIKLSMQCSLKNKHDSLTVEKIYKTIEFDPSQ